MFPAPASTIPWTVTMTQGFKLTLIWIAGCMLAFVVALNFLPRHLVDGHYLPVSNDSFYRARRILDAVANPGRLLRVRSQHQLPGGKLDLMAVGL